MAKKRSKYDKGYMDLYREIALEREPENGVYACARCSKNIGRKESLTPINFAHIKSKGSEPTLKYVASNIEIVCYKCHVSEHNGGFKVNNYTGYK